MSNPGESGHNFSYDGIYRAKIVDSKDPEKRGRVKIWCPDFMPEIQQTRGIWAYLANSQLGGRNNVDNTPSSSGNDSTNIGGDHYYQGSCFIPPAGSWVYVFFEYGNVNEPRVIGSAEFGKSKVLVENQQGQEWDKKWTILKSRQGRTIIVSDDPYDERVEITGKKRLLSPEDVSGDANSVYKIDGNQTVILLDERDGQEKILIRDYKGNFFNFDIKNESLHARFKNDINLEAGGSINCSAGKEINLNAGENANISSNKSINLHASNGSTNIFSSDNINIKSGLSVNIQGDGGNINIKAGINVQIDGSLLLQQQGAAKSASSAEKAKTATPIGDRVDPENLFNPIILPDPISSTRTIGSKTVVNTQLPDVKNMKYA